MLINVNFFKKELGRRSALAFFIFYIKRRHKMKFTCYICGFKFNKDEYDLDERMWHECSLVFYVNEEEE
jgi:hypothetical protein